MLIDFLNDAIGNMEGFRDDIATVFLLREKGRVIATGNSPQMKVLYRVTPTQDLSDIIEAPAYLGALGYLRSLVASALMKGGEIDLEYFEKDGQKVHVRSIRFRSSRLDANFECTNPEILNEKDRVTQFDKFPDAINFKFTKDMRKEFDEVSRMNTPKSDNRLFTLAFDGNYVRAIFGYGKHTTSLILTDEVSGNTEKKIQKLVSLDRFRPMIKLSSENTGEASFHERAFWVDFQTQHAAHMIATPTIRDQAR